MPAIMKHSAHLILRGKQYPNMIEKYVAGAIHAIAAASPKEIKDSLRPLRILKATELKVEGGKKNLVIVTIPFGQRNEYRKVQSMLTERLEKRFASKHFVFVARRKILPKVNRDGSKAVRPRTMTITHAHEAILDDIVFPASIAGKRVRVSNGHKTSIVLLSDKDKARLQPKVKSLAAAYKKLTGNVVTFEFPGF